MNLVDCVINYFIQIGPLFRPSILLPNFMTWVDFERDKKKLKTFIKNSVK